MSCREKLLDVGKLTGQNGQDGFGAAQCSALNMSSSLLRTRSERASSARERLAGNHATVSAVQVATRLGPRFDFPSLSGSRGDPQLPCPLAYAAEILYSKRHCDCRHICVLRQLTSLWKIALILTHPQQV